MRAGIAELQRQAHGFGGNQDIGEDNHRIDAQAAERLQRDLDGQLRRLAKLQESLLCADFPIFGEVTARLPHHPDRHPWNCLPTAGAQE